MPGKFKSYLASTCVKHPNVFMWYDMDSICVNISDFNEVGLECQDPRVRQGEALRLPFPVNSPIWSGSPSIAVDEERELRIIEQELAIEALNMDWSDVLLSRDKV